MRNRDATWFEQHQDPQGRLRSLTKRSANQVMDVINEKWLVLAAVQKMKDKEGLQLAILNSIGQELARYHHRLAVMPGLDQVWFSKEMKELNQQLYELRQNFKIAEKLTSTI